MCGTAERQALLEFLVAVFIAELMPSPGLQQRDMPVGADGAGIDADHTDIVGEALAAERAGECHQRGVAGAAADIVGVEFLAGRTDVVDDNAVSARLHLRIDGAGEIDIAEHLQFPGVAPGRLVNLVDRAAGDVAGIVDEDVDIGGFLHQAGNVLRLTEIDDMGRCVDLVCGAQALGQRFKLIAAAGGKQEVSAFFGEGFGRSFADAL